MSIIIPRRTFLRGLFALPAVIAADRLMPLRGERYEPWVNYQSWPFTSTSPPERWWVSGHCELRRFQNMEPFYQAEFGRIHWEFFPRPQSDPRNPFGWATEVRPSNTFEIDTGAAA